MRCKIPASGALLLHGEDNFWGEGRSTKHLPNVILQRCSRGGGISRYATGKSHPTTYIKLKVVDYQAKETKGNA